MRGQLHWLEMPDRVRLKLCTLVYRCMHGLAPYYLSDLCVPATVHAHLRSSVTLERSLSIPRTKTKTIGPRGFYFASSAAWNALPVQLRDPELSLNSFKTELKIHFFPNPLGYIYHTEHCSVWSYTTYRYYHNGHEEDDWMKNEDFYGGRTGPLEKFYLFIFIFLFILFNFLLIFI